VRPTCPFPEGDGHDKEEGVYACAPYEKRIRRRTILESIQKLSTRDVAAVCLRSRQTEMEENEKMRKWESHTLIQAT